MQTISPMFRSPFTDITGGLLSHQVPGARCRKMEYDMMLCIEAYGLDRGLKKCKPLIEDFRECHTMTKQFKRFLAMRKERDRQIKCGILKDHEMYLSPRVDSY